MMTPDQREKYVARIISGIVICNIKDDTYVVHEPTPRYKAIAEDIYEEKLRAAQLQGSPLFEDFLIKMMDQDMWTNDEQVELDAAPKLLEQLKVQLYLAYFNYRKREPIRQSIKDTKKRYYQLAEKRTSFQQETAEGYAVIAKNQYLICSNIRDLNDKRLWRPEETYAQDYSLTSALVMCYMKNAIGEDNLRELSRVEPWRSIWIASKVEGSLFGIPACRLTDQQKSLIAWSKFYDSVSESHESPPDDVIKDEDMVDGWLILQHRKSQEEKKKGHSNVGDKHKMRSGKDPDELFIMVENPQDAKRIEAMNTPQAKYIQRQREAMLQRHGGKISEAHMPDAQLKMREIAMEQTRGQIQKTKKG